MRRLKENHIGGDIAALHCVFDRVLSAQAANEEFLRSNVIATPTEKPYFEQLFDSIDLPDETENSGGAGDTDTGTKSLKSKKDAYSKAGLKLVKKTSADSKTKRFDARRPDEQ